MPSAVTDVRLFTLDGTQHRHPEVEAWFASPPEALHAVAEYWFNVMRSCGPDVVEVLHDGHPTACVGNAAFGYVNAFKDHVNVGFFLGAVLNDPTGILEGEGRFMRHAKVRPGVGVDKGALRELIVAAYKGMKKEMKRAAGAR